MSGRTRGRVERLAAAREVALFRRFHREAAAATGGDPAASEADAMRFHAELRAAGAANDDDLVAWLAARLGADPARIKAVLEEDDRRFRAGAPFVELAVAGPPAALRPRLGIGEPPA